MKLLFPDEPAAVSLVMHGDIPLGYVILHSEPTSRALVFDVDLTLVTATVPTGGDFATGDFDPSDFDTT